MTIALVVAVSVGCAIAPVALKSGSVVLTRQQSGQRAICPAGTEQEFTLTSDQMWELWKLQERIADIRMREDRDPTSTELCVMQHELLGYVRLADDLVYSSTGYKWSMSYPRDWTLDSRDPALVKLEPPSALPWG